MEQKNEHFSIRKLTVGAASVLIGISFLGFNAHTTNAETTDGSQANSDSDVKSDDTQSNLKIEKSSDVAETAQQNTTEENSSAAKDANKDVDSTKVTYEKQATLLETKKKPEDIILTPKDSEEDLFKENLVEQNAKDATTVPVNKLFTNFMVSPAALTESKVAANTTASEKTDVAKELGLNYTATDVHQGSNTVISINNGQKAPKDTTYGLATGFNAPDGVTVDVNSSTGQINVAATTVAQLGNFNIPVTVNNPNNSDKSQTPDTITAAVTVVQAYKNTANVDDWQGMVNALNDANVDNINLTGDVTVTGLVSGLTGPSLLHWNGYNGLMELNGTNVARKVTITGNDKTIDFGKYYLQFLDKNQKDGGSWDITVDNTKIKAGDVGSNEAGWMAPFSFGEVSADNQKKDTITFKDINANISDRGLVRGTNSTNHGSEYFTAILKGNNTIYNKANTNGSADSGSVIDAGYVRIEDGTTNIEMTDAGSGANNYGGDAIRTAQTDIHNNDGSTVYTFDVKKGATLNIKGGKDVRGIYAVDGVHGTANIDGTVNMDLGTGHSMAILAGQLNVGKDGVLDVTAATDATPDFGQVARSISNFNGGQYGVINIGVGQPINTTNVDSTTINDDGIIRVKRTSTNSGMNPIISMGSGSSAVLKGTFTINVNQGATLDLQDSRQQTNLGMIFVSGSSANSNINIVNPKYVNLQRLNTPLPSNGSDLIYLEGGGQSGRTNGVHISNAPIAEWQAANISNAPNFTWMVQSVNSMNNWGTNAGTGFTVAGQTSPQNKDGQEKFLYSNGNVIMAPSQSGTNSFEYNGSQKVNKNSDQGIITQGAGSVNYYTPYLNQFLNNYSYWTPQRLAMGSQLLTPDSPVPVKDNDLYDPEVQTINGNTHETLNDLNPKDGIKDLLKATMDENGNWTKTTVPVDGNVKDVAWYTPADATEWSNTMSGIDAPTNPEGNLKTTDTSAWAKVTYNDGSLDFVNIPLNITDKTNADIYTPSYQDASVKQGESVTTEAPTYTTDGGKAATAPAGTTYKIDDNFQVPAGSKVTIDDTTGKITVNAGANTPVGEIDVPVTVTYPGDNSTDNVTAKITVTASDANTYNPKYNPAKVNQGGKVETGNPSYGEGVTAPTGTTYKIPDGTTYPEGVTGTIDPNTGNVTVTTSSNTPEGPIFVPVTVTYPDGSQETIDAPIAVGSNTFIGTDYSVTVETNLNNLHETTANSMYPDATSIISKITYWNNNDVRKGINTQGTVVYDRANGTGNLTDVSAEWTTPINTNVDSATSSEILPGTGTSTVSDVNPAIKVTYGANSDLIKDTGNGLFTTQGGSQTVRWYGNAVTVQGATPVADAASKKLVVSPAKAGDALTDAEKALLDLTNLDKLTANKPVSYTWANDLKAGDTKGTVKITFSDNDKDGQATYLDVELPAGSLNVGTEDATGKPIVTPQGQEPNVEQGIGNVPDLPTGTTYTWKDGEPDVSKIGESPVTVTVHYPDGNTQDVPTTIIVTGTEKPTDPTNEDQKDLFKTVTRTIDGTTPDGKKVSDPQTVVFARTKTVTEQDGKAVTTYGDYQVFENGAQTDKTTGSFAQVDVPQVDGYTSQVNGNDATVIPAVDNVTPDTENVTVNVTYKETDAHKYTPEGQDVHTNIGGTPEASQGIGNIPSLPTGTKYTWKDGEPDTKTPGTKGAVVVVNYPDGSSEDVPVKVIVSEATPTPIVTPQGQEPNPEQGIGNVPDLPTNTTYTWKDGKTPDVSKIGESPVTVTVHYPDGNTQDVPTTIIVTGTEKPTDPKDPSQNTGNDETTLFKTVTRTIDGTTPDGKKVSDPQTVVFARTKTVTEQDGKAVTTYGDYQVFENGAQTGKTTGSFTQVDVPQVDGYTSQVDGKNATVIPAVDNVTPNTENVTENVTYNIDSETQQYQFVDKTNGQNVGEPISVKGDFGKQVRVSLTVPDNYELAEGQTLPTETPVLGVTNPVIKIYLDHKTEDVTNDPSQADKVSKTVIRTIDLDIAGKTSEYTKQTETLHRTATKDIVTGEVTYSAWNVNGAKFDAVPAPEEAGYTVSNPDAAPEVAITGETEDSTVTFVYGADEHSQVIDYVDKDGNVIKHYDVTGKTGETVDTNIQSNVPEGWVITDKTIPGQITFGSDNPTPINVTIEHGTKDVTNDPSQADKVNKTITRTIDLDIAGKTSEYTKQTVTIHRGATEDLVTGEVTYGAWNVDGAKFNAVTAPAEAGYTVTNPNAAPEVVVTGDTQDSTVTFVYGAGEHSQVINYVDKDDKVISSYNVTGKTGESVNTDIANHVPEGWVITGKYPTSITFGSENPAPINVTIEHGTEDVTNTDAGAKSTVTETINVTTPDGKTTPVVSSVTFNRTATKDLVTGEVTYGAWSDNGTYTFPSYTVPTVAGYTPSQNEVPAQTVKPGDKDLVFNITYSTNEQTRKIVFVDNGNTVGTQTLTGKTGTSVIIGNGNGETPLEIPTGYELVPNTTIPKTIPFNADSKDNGDITVQVQAKVDTDDGRNDQGNKDVYREVTRTITVNIEGKAPQTGTQKLYFYRTKSTNEVTGKVTYTDWTSDMTDGSTSFSDFEIPSAAGYTRTITGGTITTKDGKDYVASQSGLENGEPVNNITVTVNYTYSDQTATIKYVNNADHNDVVGTQVVGGKTGETVPVNLEVPANWKVVGGQNIPSSFTFGSEPIKDTIVYVEHGTKDVTNDPSQADKVNKTITRTVEKNVAGNITKVASQTVTLQRSATEDLVTGEITYGDWNTAKFDAVTAPEVAGYTVTNPNAAPAMDVTGNTEDSTVTFNYTADGQIRKIIFVDGGKTVGTQTLTGKTGTSVTIGNGNGETPLQVPTGYEVVPGAEIPSKVPFNGNSKDNPDITVQVEKVENPTDADKYTPKGQDVHTNVGETPNASEGIANKGDLPTGTGYTWKTTPDVSTPGTKDATVVVTYPDNSTDEVSVHVIVTKNPTDADKYDPEPKDINTTVGKEPSPEEGIGNIPSLPTGTSYTWTNGAPDVSTPGTKDVSITVTYPDGSTDVVTTKVIVTKNPTDTDKYTPEPNPITTDKGHMPDPSEGIGNKDDLPTGTKYEWTNGEPDVNTPGTRPVTITVTYPDGTTDTVTTTITVTEPSAPVSPVTPSTPTDADTYTPIGQDITTTEGEVPDASQGIANKNQLPGGTTYTWQDSGKVSDDVKKPGSHSEIIVVTYPDGSTATVTVNVNVEPKANDSQNEVPNSSNNTKPNKTKHNNTKKHGNSTTTSGIHSGDVNGESTSGVHAAGVGNGNGNRSGLNGNSNDAMSDKNAKTLPQTGAEANKAGLLGLAIASVGAILGLAGGKKKRKN